MAESTERPSFQHFSTKGDLISLGALAVVLFGVTCISDLERGMTAACSAAAIVILARYYACRRRELWFWFLLVMFVAVHAFFVVYLPWARNDFSAIILMPLGMIDFGIMCIIVRLVERGIRQL